MMKKHLPTIYLTLVATAFFLMVHPMVAIVGWVAGLVSYIIGNLQGYRQGLARMPDLAEESRADWRKTRDVCIVNLIDALVEQLAKEPGHFPRVYNLEQRDALKAEVVASVKKVLNE